MPFRVAQMRKYWQLKNYKVLAWIINKIWKREEAKVIYFFFPLFQLLFIYIIYSIII
jgi:hypothetical protein